MRLQLLGGEDLRRITSFLSVLRRSRHFRCGIHAALGIALRKTTLQDTHALVAGQTQGKAGIFERLEIAVAQFGSFSLVREPPLDCL